MLHKQYNIFGIVLLLFVWGCSTEKNSIVNKTYHNTTARYNGYFNAKESIKEGDAQIKSNHKENYDEVLPIYIYGDESAAQSVYPQMDRAIEKCTGVISKHSMYIKRTEHCKWIDNSYFLIGKSNFYKKDHFAAKQNFEYVAKEYQEGDARFDAMLWLAKTYIEQKNYSQARSMLNMLEANAEVPEN